MRIKQLDLLRGLAILLVLGRHPVIKPPESGLLGLFGSTWQRFGWTGVDLFFVLSGFLIGGLLFAEKLVGLPAFRFRDRWFPGGRIGC
jgi:peptidoglycan/LPS O-acetylase OafA/YrhL